MIHAIELVLGWEISMVMLGNVLKDLKVHI